MEEKKYTGTNCRKNNSIICRFIFVPNNEISCHKDDNKESND